MAAWNVTERIFLQRFDRIIFQIRSLHKIRSKLRIQILYKTFGISDLSDRIQICFSLGVVHFHILRTISPWFFPLFSQLKIKINIYKILLIYRDSRFVSKKGNYFSWVWFLRRKTVEKFWISQFDELKLTDFYHYFKNFELVNKLIWSDIFNLPIKQGTLLKQ